jgi:Rrf2 family protein
MEAVQMQYSVGVEYSLHCLVYLIDIPPDSSIGIKELSTFQGVSETYLSKMFGKLSKAGIVRSVPGIKGGYRLAKDPVDITFFDVVEAIEGSKPIFQCKNIKEKGYFYRNQEQHNTDTKYDDCTSCHSFCSINNVMLEAEEKMREYLRSKTLFWLNEELDLVLPKKLREETRLFFRKIK